MSRSQDSSPNGGGVKNRVSFPDISLLKLLGTKWPRVQRPTGASASGKDWTVQTGHMGQGGESSESLELTSGCVRQKEAF